jgi:hypothetical protein
MSTIKRETSGLYMTDLNLATERLLTAPYSSGQQRPRQVMTLFGDGNEDGNSNIYDDALEEDHGDDSATTKHVQDHNTRHSTRRTITAAVMRTSDRAATAPAVAS